MAKELLIIDDDKTVALKAERTLIPLGFNIIQSIDFQSALHMLKATEQIVLLNTSIPDSNGLDALHKIRAVYPETPVIALCRHEDRAAQSTFLREGVFCCLINPVNIDELTVVVEKAAQDMAQRLELSRLRALHGTRDLNPLIGKSKKMAKVLKDVERDALRQEAVLIIGECGTGKEFIARAIHNLGSRKDGPFVPVNASCMPGELFDAILFGKLDDVSDQRRFTSYGSIARANGGTLFIDEITNLDVTLQSRILEFIKTAQYVPVGGNTVVVANVRVIVSTNKNLKDVVAESLFNSELYDILHKHEIKLPPLRERKEDILVIAEHFLESSRRKYETQVKEFSDNAKNLLLNYRWPGNVSELKRAVFRAAAISEGTKIEENDLLVTEEQSYSMHDFLKDKLSKYLKDITELNDGNLYDTIISEVERSLISIVLKETKGNQLKAAKALGINRNTLRTKVKLYKITINEDNI
ncbi:MAG: sigma-54-dependent Fis family transcriptional regulator [Nitrospirae bacterium]|nr:sigma-54-dependent Fis family transcriptional regulator [Nitrospirota bacterium]